VVVSAWQAHDTGLVAVLPRFRRLRGAVRHLRGTGPTWPDRVDLEIQAAELVVRDVGSWPLSKVAVRLVSQGPPVAFVLEIEDDGSVLLNAPADAATAALLDALA
jgi:hypothetical protein